MTSIIILTFNKLDYTIKCIESIRQYTKSEEYELIVVDNKSTDGTVEWLMLQEDIVKIINLDNVGFPKGCNQGMKISKGEDILLLNNDIIVTPSWLSNLKKCLYSNKDIGAVGPVTNSAAYYQSIEVSYNNIDEMIEFSKKYNISNSSKWEERLKLIGFCLLLKREVFENVGYLDEIFTPGNFEDDDYCVRIRNCGYKLMLCKDTFIHHYGGTSFKSNSMYGKILTENERKFKEKWGFTSGENMSIYRDVLELIVEEKESTFKLLEIGCGCGANLLLIKNMYKNSSLYGVDINKHALRESEGFAKTMVQDINTLNLEDYKNYFDYILIPELLNQANDINDLLNKIKYSIAVEGRVIVTILNSTNLNYFINSKEKLTLKDEELKKQINISVHNDTSIIKCLENNGFSNIEIINVTEDMDNESTQIVNIIIKRTGKEYENLLRTKYFIITAKKTQDGDIDMENHKIDEYIRKIKFVLRRIENDIDKEDNEKEILKMLSNNEVTPEELIAVIDNSIIEKNEILNNIAVNCFNQGIYDCVIPFLQASYEINNQHRDTIYNIGFVLNEMGEKKLALEYLNRLNTKDNEILELIAYVDRA